MHHNSKKQVSNIFQEANLLIATSRSPSDFFYKAIIYVLSCTNGHVIGVNLNRFIGMVQWKDLSLYIQNKKMQKQLSEISVPLFQGGTTDPQRLLIMALEYSNNPKMKKFENNEELWQELLTQKKHDFIVTTGLSTWTFDEMNEELLCNRWIICNNNPMNPIIFSHQEPKKWEKILEEIIGRNKIPFLVTYHGKGPYVKKL